MSRIIAGSLASRRVATPPGTLTRPTTDRVRESVFAQIASHLGRAGRDPAEQLAGLAFLDLFAGSGAVGLEALYATGRRGLVGMRQRVESLGGIFSIVSAPGEGAKIEAEFGAE